MFNNSQESFNQLVSSSSYNIDFINAEPICVFKVIMAKNIVGLILQSCFKRLFEK